MWMFRRNIYSEMRRGRASVLLLPIVAFAGMSTGCANRRDPRPPSLHVLNPARNLTARRVGNQVLFTWDTPSTTTDGGAVRQPTTAVICLDSAPPSAVTSRKKPAKKASKRPSNPALDATTSTQPPCNALQRLTVASGPSQTAVDLPAALVSGPAAVLSFRVDLLNDRQHSAGPSDPVFAAGGAPPPPAGPLNIAAKRDGALVRWHVEPSTATMELKRTLIATADAPLAPVAAPSRSPALGSRAPVREVILRPDGTSPTDPGGVLDRTAVDRNTYTYIAQRVQTVTVAGTTLELRGAPSPIATFTYRDIFPPQPPTGLVSIPGGGFGGAPSIDLSWDAGPEADILGYNVFRSTDSGAFTRLNEEPLPAPSYRDRHADPGHTYTYRVTAIDRQQNESQPSSEIKETLRK